MEVQWAMFRVFFADVLSGLLKQLMRKSHMVADAKTQGRYDGHVFSVGMQEFLTNFTATQKRGRELHPGLCLVQEEN